MSVVECDSQCVCQSIITQKYGKSEIHINDNQKYKLSGAYIQSHAGKK